IHTPYLSINDFLAKMQMYSSLFAEQYHNKKKAGLAKAILHSWLTFIKSYIFKRGFLGGKEGYLISAYNSHTAFYKYLKLEELNDTK
ncbi:MAG: glycosyltransferase family 2 protein, partial [Anaerolineae bacterium]